MASPALVPARHAAEVLGQEIDQRPHPRGEPVEQVARALRAHFVTRVDFPGRNEAAHERAIGKFSEAEPILIKHLATVQKLRGAEHPDVANAMTLLGVLYEDEGRNDLAESTLTNALALDRKLPAGNLTLRTCLTAMARLRLTQRKYAEAESELHEAMNGTGNQNTQIWDTFDRQSLLGASLLGQGKYADAEPLLLSGYEGLQKQSPAISVDANLPEAGQRLVQLYTAWEKPDKADEWRRRLKAAE